MATVLEIFPSQVRVPGPYVSPDIPVPLRARFLAVDVGGRDTWGVLRTEQPVMTLRIEVNTTGQWRFVAGGDIRPGATINDGQRSTVSRYRFRLEEPLVPAPYYRVTLTCHSVCLCSVHVIFDE